MKKIFKEGVPEESEYRCDKHPDSKAYSSIKAEHWYGSKYDGQTIEIHLCDECMTKFHKNVKETFDIVPKEPEESDCDCGLYGRMRYQV